MQTCEPLLGRGPSIGPSSFRTVQLETLAGPIHITCANRCAWCGVQMGEFIPDVRGRATAQSRQRAGDVAGCRRSDTVSRNSRRRSLPRRSREPMPFLSESTLHRTRRTVDQRLALSSVAPFSSRRGRLNTCPHVSHRRWTISGLPDCPTMRVSAPPHFGHAGGGDFHGATILLSYQAACRLRDRRNPSESVAFTGLHALGRNTHRQNR